MLNQKAVVLFVHFCYIINTFLTCKKTGLYNSYHVQSTKHRKTSTVKNWTVSKYIFVLAMEL